MVSTLVELKAFLPSDSEYIVGIGFNDIRNLVDRTINSKINGTPKGA